MIGPFSGGHLPLPVVAAGLGPFYRLALNAALPYRVQRALLDLAAPLQQMPAGSVVRRTSLAGRPAERITVGATERPTAMLYLHGGAYTIGSLATHRSLAAHLARESQSVVYTLDYRLAPEHPFPAGLDDAVAAFRALLDDGRSADTVTLAGDSAGGGLALATGRRLVDRFGIRPAALGLISPWVDPADRAAPFPRDLVVNTGWAYDAGDKYLGDGDPTDPGYAPLHGDLSGLPPTLVHVGTSEILYGQITELVARMRAAGTQVELTEYPDLWHVAHLQASLLREAADAVRELGGFLGTHARSGARGEPVSRSGS